MQSIYSKAEELMTAGTPAALCIVTEAKGSTPRSAGAKMIVFADGTIYGTIGGGSIEKEVIEQAVELIHGGVAAKFRFQLKEDLGMHCGGNMEVYIEPLSQINHLYIFGGGHIGKALSSFAIPMGFNVHVIDPRPEIYDDTFERCDCIKADFLETADTIEFPPLSYVVIVTPKHLYDEEVLARVARKPHRYLGMIGSKNKVALLRKRFITENILTEEELAKVDMPIGLPMNAETPQEIAISILAKIIDVKNTKA